MGRRRSGPPVTGADRLPINHAEHAPRSSPLPCRGAGSALASALAQPRDHLPRCRERSRTLDVKDAAGELDPKDEEFASDEEFAAQIRRTYRQTGPVAQAGGVIFGFGVVAAIGAVAATVANVVAALSGHNDLAGAGVVAVLAAVFYAAVLIGVGKSMTMFSSYVELRTLEMERHWIAEEGETDNS